MGRPRQAAKAASTTWARPESPWSSLLHAHRPSFSSSSFSRHPLPSSLPRRGGPLLSDEAAWLAYWLVQVEEAVRMERMLTELAPRTPPFSESSSGAVHPAPSVARGSGSGTVEVELLLADGPGEAAFGEGQLGLHGPEAAAEVATLAPSGTELGQGRAALLAFLRTPLRPRPCPSGWWALLSVPDRGGECEVTRSRSGLPLSWTTAPAVLQTDLSGELPPAFH